MSAPEPRLDQIQRWMQCVIMHPGGVSEGVDSPQARQHVDITLGELEQTIGRSRALSSADRLEIYVNAYHARLTECLDEEFAVTRYALGEDLFAAVAFGYLQHYPSHSYTLGRLGARFPGYLAESRLHAAAAPEGTGPTWPDFVIELATLERSLYEVFDGPGTEQSGTLAAADLGSMAPEQWATARLVAAPCLRLHQFEHPVSDFWEDCTGGAEPAACEPRRDWLAINRRDYVVERHALSGEQHSLLSGMVAGQPLAAAIERAAAATQDAEAFETQLGGWFADWAAHGFFVRIEISGD